MPGCGADCDVHVTENSPFFHIYYKDQLPGEHERVV